MKKLTQAEINELLRLVERHAIKYYDVQIEIVDHYASAIEEIWETEPNLSFLDAKKRVYREFWDFKTLEKEKRKVLEKKYWRDIRNGVLEWFSFPKIVGSLIIYGLLLQLFSIQPAITDGSLECIAILSVGFLIYLAIKGHSFKKELGVKFLQFNVANSILTIIPTYGFFIINIIGSSWTYNHPEILSGIITLWILSSIISWKLYFAELTIIKQKFNRIFA